MFNQIVGAEQNARLGTADAAAIYKTQAIAQSGNQPRELRVLERVEGLSGGIGELATRLEMFIARLQNAPTTDETKNAAMPPQGLADNITMAEQRLRYCLELIAKINGAF